MSSPYCAVMFLQPPLLCCSSFSPSKGQRRTLNLPNAWKRGKFTAVGFCNPVTRWRYRSHIDFFFYTYLKENAKIKFNFCWGNRHKANWPEECSPTAPRRSRYSAENLCQCLYRRLTVVLRQTWKTANLSFNILKGNIRHSLGVVHVSDTEPEVKQKKKDLVWRCSLRNRLNI